MTRFVLALAVLLCTHSRSDDYHYKDILVGERASGLGGAFVAISDDPSGIYHNPAGLAFSTEDYLSISANAYSRTKETFKDIFDGQNYDYQSGTLVPSLFAFIQTTGDYKFGFAVIVPRAELKDQSDTVIDARKPDVKDQKKFTRRLLQQTSTYLFGPAIAKEVSKNFSVGISLLGMARIEKYFDNQRVEFGSDGNGTYYMHETDWTREGYGLYPRLGFQYMPAPHWSVGLALSKVFTFRGNTNFNFLASKLDGQKEPAPKTGIFNNDYEVTRVKFGFTVHDPLEVSIGVAYFPTREWLFTLQLDGYEAKFRGFATRPVANIALGAEYFPAEWIAFRTSLFTNNANTAEVTPTGTNQPPHVNLLGTGVGVSVYRTGTSLTFGANYSLGNGQGQAFSDITSIQSVELSNLTLQLSGSYQL